MKKIWCVYRILWPIGIGKIVRSDRYGCDILYSEGQHYPAELWDLKYVKRFDTVEEAISEYGKRSSDPIEKIREDVYDNFPSIREKCRSGLTGSTGNRVIS